MKVLGVVVMCIGSHWYSSTSLAEAAVVLSAGTVRGFPGRPANVPFSLRQTNMVSALQFDVFFQTNKLSSGSLRTGSVGSNAIVRWRQISAGVQRVLVYPKAISTLSNRTLIGEIPFTVPQGDLSNGGHVTLSNAVASTTNAQSITPIHLISGGVQVGPVFRGEDGIVSLYFEVKSNQTYVVQATTNFVNWINISTNTTSSNYFIVEDSDAVKYPYRFYRAAPFTISPIWTLQLASRSPAGQVTLKASGVLGQHFMLQVSSDLIHWSSLSNYSLTINPLTIVDPTAAGVPMRFYRLMPFSTSTGGTIGSPQLRAGGQVTFSYPVTIGRTYVLQVSTNLTTWSELNTNVAAGNLINYTNLIVPGVARRFFRVYELP